MRPLRDLLHAAATLRDVVAADDPVLCGCWGRHVCSDCSLWYDEGRDDAWPSGEPPVELEPPAAVAL